MPNLALYRRKLLATVSQLRKRQSLDRTASIRLKRAFVYIFGPLIMIDSANWAILHPCLSTEGISLWYGCYGTVHTDASVWYCCDAQNGRFGTVPFTRTFQALWWLQTLKAGGFRSASASHTTKASSSGRVSRMNLSDTPFACSMSFNTRPSRSSVFFISCSEMEVCCNSCRLLTSRLIFDNRSRSTSSFRTLNWRVVPKFRASRIYSRQPMALLNKPTRFKRLAVSPGMSWGNHFRSHFQLLVLGRTAQ
jgi:hypothetical protein